MFGNNASDDFEDEDALDPGYKPPQTFDTPQAFPTVAQPTTQQPTNNYPFAAPASQVTWQQPHTAAPVTSAAGAPQPFAQPVAQPFAQPVAHAASTQPQSVSGSARRIPAAWGGTAPTLAAASTALPTHTTATAAPTTAAPPSVADIFAAVMPAKPTPFIPVAAAYTPNSVATANSALPAAHVSSRPMRDGAVPLPTPVTSAVNTSTYSGPSAFSNGESYFDDED